VVHDRRVRSGQHVAGRVAGLGLDDSGHLAGRAYLDMACRGGLLVDLVLAGRLGQTEDSIDLDPAPTGWAPADRVLAELGALEEQSLDWWLQHSHLGLADLAAALLQDGSWFPLPRHAWQRTPRYAARDEQQAARDAALVAGTTSPVGGADAALVCLAGAAGLAGRSAGAPGEELLAATGDARWVCQLVVDFLTWARATGTAVSSASQAALWAGLPY
jgi:hypothetical protein